MAGSGFVCTVNTIPVKLTGFGIWQKNVPDVVSDLAESYADVFPVGVWSLEEL